MSKKKTDRSASLPKIIKIYCAQPEISGFCRVERLSGELCDALRLSYQAIAIFRREESYMTPVIGTSDSI